MKKILIMLSILITVMAYGQNNTNTTGKDDTTKSKAIIPDGFEAVKWGTLLSKAKASVKGKLSFTDDKTIIVTKRNEISYHYGFFYIDVEKWQKAKGKENMPKDMPDEGKLFYVAIKFPYLQKDTILKKIETKYGKSTSENIVNDQGAITWDSEKTLLILWVDRYEGKPFCRRITYLSKDIAKEVNQFSDDFFFYPEKDTTRKLMSNDK